MIKRTIEISSGPCRLFVKNGQLALEKPESPPVIIPSEDIGVLILNHPAITLTQGVLAAMAENGAVVLTCGKDHMPSGIHLPFVGHGSQTARYYSQIEAKAPLNKRLWQKIVMAKIALQAEALSYAGLNDGGLRHFPKRVQSGDSGNLEAQAAQRYWPLLLGKNFRRDRNGKPPNDLLNYGYMVLRATIARALCAAGLLPALGVFHRSRGNAFCLADDLMEPFRPYVDLKVLALCRQGRGEAGLDKESKRFLLSVLQDAIPINECRQMVSLAAHTAAQSLARSLEEGEDRIILPTGLPEILEQDE